MELEERSRTSENQTDLLQYLLSSNRSKPDSNLSVWNSRNTTKNMNRMNSNINTTDITNRT